jgi:glycosyltransferase involved in cell wall biosynthesis
VTSLSGKRILIDATMARGGGGFTYLVNMLPALAAAEPEARFLVLLRTRELAESIPPLPNVELDCLPERGLVGRFVFLLREAAARARRFEADVYFSVAEYAPPGAHCPVVVCLRNPNVFTPLDQGWSGYQRLRLGALRRLAEGSARRAARVVFVSEDSAGWMGEAAGIPEARRAVVHHGIDPARLGSGDGGSEASASASKPHGILSVSTIYRYKNFVRLIEAYVLLARQLDDPPPLTIVGDDQDAEYSGRIRAARENAGALADRIHLVGAVPYREIATYYAGARLFVFPSYLETFGHPLLEALVAELPVVAADIPVFRELAGDAAVYADPHDASALASAMAQLLTDDALAQRQVELGKERVRDFGWPAAAVRLAGVLASAAQ